MLEGGPLLPYDFRVIEFSKEEKKAWDWYKAHTIVAFVILDGETYGFSRLHTFCKVTHMNTESKYDKGIWIDNEKALYMNKEVLGFYV